MKPICYLILIALALLCSCANNSSSENKEGTLDTVKRQKRIDTLAADKNILVYSYNTAYTDSSLICQQWLVKDSLIKKRGDFYYTLPVEGEFINDYILSEAKGKSTYETFDSLICETGGHSAWNKYVFTYDKLKRPALVKHYKAWYENYDDEENPATNNKPDYQLAEQIYFTYSTDKTEQVTKDETGKIIEKLTRSLDDKSRVRFEEWNFRDEKRFRIFYRYNSHPQSTAAL